MTRKNVSIFFDPKETFFGWQLLLHHATWLSILIDHIELFFILTI